MTESLDLFPDPHNGKLLDPDPQQTNVDPGHWFGEPRYKKHGLIPVLTDVCENLHKVTDLKPVTDVKPVFNVKWLNETLIKKPHLN